MELWNKKLCRACLCLSTKESYRYFLFEHVSPEAYQFCTSIEVTENEDLPKGLCDGCYEQILKYTDFKRTCVQSQYTLTNCWDGQENVTVQKYNKNLFQDKQINTEEKFEIDSVKDELPDRCDTDDKFEFASVKEEHSEHCDDAPRQELSNIKPGNKIKIQKSEVSKRKRFSCELCNRKFRYLERFEAHKQEHEGTKVTLRCYPCNKSFSTWSGLQRHRAASHKRTRVSETACGVCGRVCTSVNARSMHERTHGPKSACVCHVCGKRVTTAVILKAHLDTHNADRERRHTCEHCGKKFFTKTILLSHISRQHTGKRYICEICSFPFTDKYNLAKHLLKHEGKKLFKCDICDKAFATNGSLVEHKRIHSGERPFGCIYCPKSFVSKRRLLDHHRIHTGDKPHQCSVCSQKFTQRGTLQRHMKVHDVRTY